MPRELDISPATEQKHFKRSENFQKIAATFVIPLALTLATAACSETKNKQPDFPIATPAGEQQSQPEFTSEQERLKAIINSLPETEIKRLLMKKVVPILDNPSGTTTLDIAGMPIKVHGLEVTRKTQFTNQTFGEFRPGGNPKKVQIFFPTEEKTLHIPFPYLLKQGEKKTVPLSNIANDGTPFLDITFPKIKPLHEDIAPTIDIVTIDPSIRKPEFKKLHKFLEDFTYIKEACGLLTHLLYLEDTITKMRELGFETNIDSVSTNGESRNIEGVNHSLSVLGANNGRYIAAQDLAGYLFAVKAFGKDLNMDYVIEPQRPFYEKMKSASIGNDPARFLEESFQWIVNLNPSEIPIHYVGNLNRIP